MNRLFTGALENLRLQPTRYVENFQMMRYVMCVLLSTALDAAAQERLGTVYVNAGASFPHQAALSATSPPPFAAPGGNTIGWLVGGGVFLSPQTSVEVEGSRTGVMRSRRAGRHNTSEIGLRQDLFVSFGVKGHTPISPTVRFEPMAGIVFIATEGSSSSFSGDQRAYLELDWARGFVFGADVRVGLGGRRVAILPGFRMAFRGEPKGSECVIGFSGQPICGEGTLDWHWHYPRWTQRPSVSLAVNF